MDAPGGCVYVQLFRNTPPLVQLYFFYFGLSALLPQIKGAFEVPSPLLSGLDWAIISLTLFAGAFNVEIFRAGIEAVPGVTIEAARSLDYTRVQIFRYVVLPLAARISLPALSNNLVNLVKTTTLGYVIAVPELLYASNQIWSDDANVPEMMMMMMVVVLLVVYLVLVGLLVWGMSARAVAAAAGDRGMRQRQAAGCVLPVILPVRGSASGASGAGLPIVRLRAWHGLALGAAIVLSAEASATAGAAPGRPGVLTVLLRWSPLLWEAFAFDVLISVLAMAIGTVLMFFLYCYPIARLTAALERRYAVRS